jgi:aminoglycoside phosphotransferase (APT) family kinase protein
VTAVLDPKLIDEIFEKYEVSGAWKALESTGVANWIYGTRDVVLRVATDHHDGVRDARTESVAAPAAHAAGILTPRMIAFDDTRAMVDRPFSLWERVHGATLGRFSFSPETRRRAWRDVGRELARVHRLVTACPDPHGYLDTPGDEPDVDRLISTLVADGRLETRAGLDIQAACHGLAQAASLPGAAFTHGDVHQMNVMCEEDGKLLALIDWGDAGWCDPMHDFSSMPIDVIPFAVAGYEAESGVPFDADSRARLVRVRTISALDHFVRHPESVLDGETLRRFATKSCRPAS